MTPNFSKWAPFNKGLFFILVDVLDHLGHIVFVLAELGGIFEDFFLFLLAFGLLGVFLLGLGLGIIRQGGIGLRRLGNFFGAKIRLDLLIGHRLGDRRGGARAPRLEQRLRIERRAAMRADDRVAPHVVIARAAIRAQPLHSPFRFSHLRLLGQDCA